MSNIKTALLLAHRSIIRGQKSTSLLLVFVLSMSFLNLMLLSGVLGGISVATEQNVIDTETAHIVVSPQREPERHDYIGQQRALRDRIEDIPGVEATARRYSLAGSVSFDGDGTGDPAVVSVGVVGIDAADDRRVLTLDEHVVSGEYLAPSDIGQIVLGADIAGGFGEPTTDDLGGVEPGDAVEVTLSNGAKRVFQVKGIYKAGFFSGLGIISAADAQDVLGTNDGASQILVRVDPELQTLESYLEQIQSIDPLLRVRIYNDLLGGVAAVIVAFQVISLVVTVVSIIVAAVTLFVLLYVNAMNKRRQIGVLNAVGVRRGIIVGSYVFQALFYTLSAVILGLGIVFLLVEPLLKTHPIPMPMGDVTLSLSALRVGLSALGLFAASLCAGFISSWRVARQDILKSIWGA